MFLILIMGVFAGPGCSCLPYSCVCNENIAVQQHSAVSYHNSDNNNQQQWASGRDQLQNYQMLGPSSVVSMTSTDVAVANYGFVNEPVQTAASAVQTVCRQPLSTYETQIDNFLQVQQNASSFNNYSPTTVLDLGSGTIHKNSNDDNWQNYQTSVDYHQCFQQNCSDHSDGHMQYVTQMPIKVESVCSEGQEPLDLINDIYYQTVTSHGDYYTHVSSSSPSTVTVKTNTMGLDDSNSIDFIGDGSTTAGDYMVTDSTKLLTNNNYYMDDYYATETNTSSSEYQLDANIHWSYQ